MSSIVAAGRRRCYRNTWNLQPKRPATGSDDDRMTGNSLFGPFCYPCVEFKWKLHCGSLVEYNKQFTTFLIRNVIVEIRSKGLQLIAERLSTLNYVV